ncbi:MAG: hypothetical protein KGI98_16150 [Euryarchaeota archaeon]|nr:hypothetical protein [Euryarchaeota archaeon]MDE1879531.1 hypothetical protein [Euryarchaeota archaeon]
MDRYRYLVVAEAYRSWDTETRFEAMAWQRVLARNIPTIRQANAIARKAAQVIARRGLAVRTFYTPLKLLRPLGSGRLGILGPGNPELVDGDDEE